MTLLVRHTDVLGGYDPAKGGGGIVGGFNPLNKFLGWRHYAVVDTYDDPTGIEFPAVRFLQTKGPPPDTIAEISQRTGGLFVEKKWPYPAAADARGSYPSLAWYFLDPVTLAFVAGPILPLGDTSTDGLEGFIKKALNLRGMVVQWFEHTPPTGPYIAFLVSRDPSPEFQLWVSGHPVEIIAEKLTQKGETYDAASATAVTQSLGERSQIIIPVTSADQTPQQLIDSLSEMYGIAVRRSETTGKAEFVHWRKKFGALPTPVIDKNNVRGDGGPTFELKDDSRVNTVKVTAPLVTPWVVGSVTVPEFSTRKFLGIPIGVKTRFVAKPITQGSEKPASGLVITTPDVTFHLSSDGAVRDSVAQGEQVAEFDLPGMPAVTNVVDGGASPLNFEQWAEGLARYYFDAHGRGRVLATVPLLRGVGDEAQCLLGEAAQAQLAHFPNAQLGQSPTSQRGGVRPFRIFDRTPEAAGPLVKMADEGTGVQYGTVPEIRVLSAGDPNLIVMRVDNADDLAADGALVLFELLVFGPTETLDFSKPGIVYTIRNAIGWTTNPFPMLFGEFPPKHQVFFRAYAFLQGGSLSDPTDWNGIGGPITAPTATISNLVIDQVTNEGARLTWSYDESPQVGDVKIEIRDITGGIIGAWSAVTGSPFAPGTETTTLTGYTSGKHYEVRVILDDAGEYGNELRGTFATTGGKISGLGVTSVTAGEAKLNWTNTDAARSVLIELQADTDADFWTFATLPPGSNRQRLVNLIPSTDYDVRVSLLENGVPVGDGAFGAALTDAFTTLAASVQLEFPLMGGPFWDWDPGTSQRHDGRFGCRLNANPNNNTVAHDIVVLLAVETAVGSGTPGAYTEQTPMPATPGVDLWFIADAPNDGKKRYMKAISRDPGGAYLDSIETVVVEATPWADTGPQPPAGGGIPNTYTISEAAVTAGASRTGSFLLPDGAELFRVESPNSKAFRIRLYKDSATVTSDASRPVTDSLWPAALLFDTTVESSDSWLIDLPLLQRIRFILSQHEDGKVWYRLTSLEAGTEDLECRLYYFAAPAGGGGSTLV